MTSRRLTLTLAACLGVAAAAWTNGSAGVGSRSDRRLPAGAQAAENATVTRQVYAQAIRDGASPRVLLAAFEAAWVESRLNNYSNGDLDWMGVFQQRAGWGSADARTTVATATHAFIVRAKNVDGTSAPSVTAGQIAQKVQASAYPDRYDQAKGTATALLSAYGVTNGVGTRMIDPNAYMDVSNSGQIYAWNSRYLGGSPGGYSGRFTDAEVTSGDNGYWLLTSAGQIYAYGSAGFFGGSPGGFTRAITAMSATADGRGYVLVSRSGQVYAYGNASFRGGSPAGISGEITDISSTPGSGYLLISSSGQHYSYGDAPFIGNPSGASPF